MMWTILTNLMKNKTILYLFLAGAILFGIYQGIDRVHDSIYDQGYEAGVQKQSQVYQQNQAKLTQEFDVLQAKADADRKALNNQIAALSQSNKDLEEKLAAKKKEQTTEVINYAKTSSGSMSCFAPNDDGLRIINKSFPTSTN